MKTSKSLLVFILLFTTLYSWYPDYTILATDFKLRSDFLSPAQIQSVSLAGLGPYFKNIYHNPLDDVFQNPAYLSYGPDNYLYLDVASEEYQQYDEIGVIPAYYRYDEIILEKTTVIDPYPYYWSPYSAAKPITVKEPVFRAVYLGKLPVIPLRFGITAEYFYNEEKFYRPYWYWGRWFFGYDALGAAYESDLMDPYQDYRLVESGENTETNTGYRLNGFLAIPLFRWLSLGLGVTYHVENTDGKYHDMDHWDDSDYADEYINHKDNYRNCTQDFNQNEIRAGLIWTPKENAHFGFTAGLTPGKLERTYVVNDTSNYFSAYNLNQQDSSVYRSHRSTEDTKHWTYDGNSMWGTIHGDISLSEGLLLRFSIHAEDAQADLDEKEDLWQSSYYYHTYRSTYNDTIYRRISESDSWVTLDRTGRGEFTRDRQRLSLGVDWTLSPTVRFIGGVCLDRIQISQNASEPFLGEKYSSQHYENNPWSDYTTRITTRIDDKQFSWWYDRSQTNIAVPLGLFIGFNENIEFQVGLTKIMEQVDVIEGYDLIVYHESTTKTVDGVITTDEDSSYVEGHEFPGDHYFVNEFQLNAGVSVKVRDRFKATAVITESILEPRSLKIGAQIIW